VRATQWAPAYSSLGDVFIGLIRMMIAPAIFCTIVHGIASMSDLKSVGRVQTPSAMAWRRLSPAVGNISWMAHPVALGNS
jgi:Na+/H+-dicarboxylate symporter